MSQRPKRSKMAKDWLLGEVSYFKHPRINLDSTVVWFDLHSPTDESDLAIHKDKIKEVRNSVEESFNNKRNIGGSIMMLTGPSGAGKTTCIRVLSRSLGYKVELFEWMDEGTSTDLFEDLESYVKNLGVYGRSLCEVGNSTSMDTVVSNRIIVLENLPSCVVDNPSRFHRLLRQHTIQAQPTCLLVLITSNFHSGANDIFRKKSLCPPNLCSELCIRVVEFNPVAPTLVFKALSRISLSESKRLGIKVPSRQFLQRIAQECSGDLRSAVNQLQFELGSEKSVKFGPNEHLHRDNSLSIFRALGKILYCKRLSNVSNSEKIPKLPEHLQNWHRNPLEFDLEEVFNYCHLDGDTIVSWLHENYPDFAPHLTSLQWVMDKLSWSDAYLSGGLNWRLGLTPASDWNALGNLGFGSNQRRILCSANYHYPALVTARSILLADEMDDCLTTTLDRNRTKSFRPLRSPYTKNYWKLSQERSQLVTSSLFKCENSNYTSLGKSIISSRNQLIMDLLPLAMKIHKQSLLINPGIIEVVMDVCSFSKSVSIIDRKSYSRIPLADFQNTYEDNQSCYLCPADAIAEGDALPIEEVESDNENPVSTLPKMTG